MNGSSRSSGGGGATHQQQQQQSLGGTNAGAGAGAGAKTTGSTLQETKRKFDLAATKVKTVLKVKPTDAQLLTLYGLYKQATLGDMPASTKEPSRILKAKDHAKYKAWLSRKGMTSEVAMSKYIDFVAALGVFVT